jgi:GMP reductase
MTTIVQDIKLDFKDVLIRPKRSQLNSRVEVSLERTYNFVHAKKVWTGVPIIAANMDHTGTLEMAEALSKHKAMVALSKFIAPERLENFLRAHGNAKPFVFLSAGLNDKDLPRLKDIAKNADFDCICLDVANGYTQRFANFVRQTRDAFPDKIIMAGNVVTGEMTEELILSGADIVKVGIGPGSVCTTRKKTGVGYPQLSAVMECADAAHGLKGLICADGGCVVPGDVAKAFAGGADFVMLGGMFAGHSECSGEIFEKNGESFKRFYGMSSEEAMNKYHGQVADYRASEGKSVDIPYRGPVEPTLMDILGGVRSTCTYVGAKSLKELSKRTTFIRVNAQINDIFNPMTVQG